MFKVSSRQLLGLTAWISGGLIGVELLLVRLRAGVVVSPPSPDRLWIDALLLAVAAAGALLTVARLTRRESGPPALSQAALQASLAFSCWLLLLAFARAGVERALLPAEAPGFFCSTLEADAGWTQIAWAVTESALILDAAVLPLFFLGIAVSHRRLRGPQLRRVGVAFGVVAAAGLAFAQGMGALDPDPSMAPPGGAGCAPNAAVRSYDVSAITVDVTLNRFGHHVPNSFMYVLDENIPGVREEEKRPLPDRVSVGLRKDLIQPLVIRANLGECLVIRFTNRLEDERVSLNVHGLPHSVAHVGGAVGRNADTFANPGQRLTYVYPIPSDPAAERGYFIHDHGDSRQLNAMGLFGSLVVEPAGAVYRDPETGEPSSGGNWEAIIDVPGQEPDFREMVLLYHEIGDETFEEVLDKDGNKLPVVDRLSGAYRPSARALNYRSEPFGARLELNDDKSQAYGSYAFGDPATPIPRSYLGEPTKMRIVHGGSETFHVHHLHGGGTRWRRNPHIDPVDFNIGLQKTPLEEVQSLRVDSQAIGPGSTFTTEHECGAGGCQQAAGDFLFHCHIQHHYLAGMWAFWRVFDTRQPDLAVIPDRAPPPDPVVSTELIGRVVEGKRLVPRAQLTDATRERALEDFIEAQLPPPGERFDPEDATVWDWVRVSTSEGPLYLGEPETTRVWPNYKSPTPQQRPPILFNSSNGRYAWPLLRPHLGKRPPFSGNGHTGSPWLGENGSALRPDGLCPSRDQVTDARRHRRVYPLSQIALPIPVTRSLVNPLGRTFVLNEHKRGLMEGSWPIQPLVIRANTLDCVDILFTNEIPDEKTLLEDGRSKANLHTHFVQFDPQGSDGVISGFSYEQSVKPYKQEGRLLLKPAPAGSTEVELARVEGLRPGIWLGIGLGEGMCTPPMGGAMRACTEIRKIAAISGSVVTLDRALEVNHAAAEYAGVEFVQANWYVDVDTGTVFWHDHISPGGWLHGLFGALIIEPRGSTYHDPRTGAEVRAGTIVDIHAPRNASIAVDQRGSFREVFLGINDRGGGGRFPDHVADGIINFRSEDFDERDGTFGQLFSSVRNGDPITPLPRAYLGDPVIFRTLNAGTIGSGIQVTGHRFHLEPNLRDSPLVDTAPLHVSERFDLVLQGGAGGTAGRAGDFLYRVTVAEQFSGGAWGILRVFDTPRADLKPLPDRPTLLGGTGFPHQTFTGGRSEPATDPGNPCPASATVRRYETQARLARVTEGDEHESDAVVYSLLGRPGAEPPRDAKEPLVLRVNHGECLEIQLTNNTPLNYVGLTLSKLSFDPQGSYGTAVGFNRDSTVAPGATRTYRFFAGGPLYTSMFLNLAEPPNTATELEDTPDSEWGVSTLAFGAVIVEPPGSVYLRPDGTLPLTAGINATIQTPTGRFREMVILVNDEDPRVGSNTMPYHAEVRDMAGFSYHANPLDDRRSGPGRGGANAFDSNLFGDPDLVLQADVGERVVFRVGQPFGEQSHTFAVDGHRWSIAPRSPSSERVSSELLIPGYSFEAELVGGAGAGITTPGDYLFFDGRLPFLEKGLWGILRVGDPPLKVAGADRAPPPKTPAGEVGPAPELLDAAGPAVTPPPGGGKRGRKDRVPTTTPAPAQEPAVIDDAQPEDVDRVRPQEAARE